MSKHACLEAVTRSQELNRARAADGAAGESHSAWVHVLAELHADRHPTNGAWIGRTINAQRCGTTALTSGARKVTPAAAGIRFIRARDARDARNTALRA